MEHSRNMKTLNKRLNDYINKVEKAGEAGTEILLAFRDQLTDTYYVGWCNQKDNHYDLHPVGAKERVYDEFDQYSLEYPDPIPTAKYEFRPERLIVCDLRGRFINRFIPSKYMAAAQVQETAQIPEGIQRVINHATGGNAEVFEHFINWLAVLFTTRTMTGSGWILHGTTGTGKGTLFHHIIRPLIGDRYCHEMNLANLEGNCSGIPCKTAV